MKRKVTIDVGTATYQVIVPDAAYHWLIERRSRAYISSGHPDWIKCIYCKQYDEPHKLRVPRSKTNRIKKVTWAYHPKCAEKNNQKYKK